MRKHVDQRREREPRPKEDEAEDRGHRDNGEELFKGRIFSLRDEGRASAEGLSCGA